MSLADPPVDSPEGMRILIDWARGHGVVLNGTHRALARKHGVDVTGVRFSEPLPAQLRSSLDPQAFFEALRQVEY